MHDPFISLRKHIFPDVKMQPNCSESLFVALVIYFLDGLNTACVTAQFATDAIRQADIIVDNFSFRSGVCIPFTSY